MCVLCGEFVSQPHWTDRRVEDAARSSDADLGDYHRDRRRDRIRRVALANEVLAHYGLRVSDWNGSKYLLRDLKGRQELVQDLGAMWPVAAKLSGRAPDPLDPALLQTLNGS